MIKKPKKTQEETSETKASKAESNTAETEFDNIADIDEKPSAEVEADVSCESELNQENALDEAKKELAELKDVHLRLRAEYENYKKRTAKEKEAIYNDSVRDTVSALLPVLDNFERAMVSFSAKDKEGDFYKGMEMIFNQTVEVFTKLGVTPIEALGCEFNPELHNAVMHIDDDSIADNTIVEEFQKGYIYRDKVIRYSMVKVAN